MSFLILGSHPAMDFLNTAYAPDGEPVETIGNGRALMDWLVAASLVEEAKATELLHRFGRKALDSAAAEVRDVRKWARTWLDRWRLAPTAGYSTEIAVLNALLAREVSHRALVQIGADRRVVERRRFDNAEALLAPIARAVAALISEEQPSLVKHCAGPGCTLWFLDRTKAHRRRFCSASACGNRAKVAAFRERQRG